MSVDFLCVNLKCDFSARECVGWGKNIPEFARELKDYLIILHSPISLHNQAKCNLYIMKQRE